MAVDRPSRLATLLIAAITTSGTSSCEQVSKTKSLPPPQSSETRYVGIPLQGTTFQCKSDEVAAAGFWRDVTSNSVKQQASVAKQSGTTYWRITLKGRIAEVTGFSATTQTVDEPQMFTVEQTTGGLLLIYRDRAPGESTQIITIDLGNGSFVYSSQHVNPFLNRANVWHGSCAPSV